ncbi:hypothetical protein D3Q23_24605 [Salmonella enterica]|nr:hypothetical protein [Salmonella enterica]EBK0598398.1 hypothetical protein [Salmonella enterica]
MIRDIGAHYTRYMRLCDVEFSFHSANESSSHRVIESSSHRVIESSSHRGFIFNYHGNHKVINVL